MDKLVSIIVPNYNKSDFISETIESVLSQSYNSWELLIIDDGSSDKSWEIIKDFEQKDERITAYRNTTGKKGASVCRNIGLNKAKGGFVVFLDSDDILVQTCLKNRVEEFNKNPKLEFIVFPMGTFYNTVGDSKSSWIPPNKNHLDKFLSHNLPWSIMQPIWKKDFLFELGGFDESLTRLQDVELHTRVLIKKDTKFIISKSKTPDCFYRIDDERKIINSQLFYSNLVESVIQYVLASKDNLIANDNKSKVLFLKGTIFKSITSLLHAQNKNEIDDQLTNKYINQLMSFSDEMDGSKNILSLYIKMYWAGFYKVKGFNFIFNKLFIYA